MRYVFLSKSLFFSSLLANLREKRKLPKARARIVYPSLVRLVVSDDQPSGLRTLVISFFAPFGPKPRSIISAITVASEMLPVRVSFAPA